MRRGLTVPSPPMIIRSTSKASVPRPAALRQEGSLLLMAMYIYIISGSAAHLSVPWVGSFTTFDWSPN